MFCFRLGTKKILSGQDTKKRTFFAASLSNTSYPCSLYILIFFFQIVKNRKSVVTSGSALCPNLSINVTLQKT